MVKTKKSVLPKDFEAQLEKGDLSALKAVFDMCDVNARGGVLKQTALAFAQCPDELARWLIDQGADLAAGDSYGDTPLHSRSRHWKGRIEVLLELGANPNFGGSLRSTPLHAAAGSCNVANARLLLQYGARVDALNHDGQTPLAYALQRCSNAQIQSMAVLAELLIAAGAQRTAEMKKFVTRIGTDFEFHRSGFNPALMAATCEALEKLCAIFDVPAIPHRVVHDGSSPIALRTEHWEDRHEELWGLLVPSSGHADTVQGEVVRIAGRIHDELDRNGGVNWDSDYNKMAAAFLLHVASGIPLDTSLLGEARKLVTALKGKAADARRLCELGVEWVSLNPIPTKLKPPDYRR
ncbi:MAG: ankyrin repeat domain-containing protein [Micropepsaceae bacterium]